MRTPASQDAYILNIRANFATEIYRQAALRRRGIAGKCEPNGIVPTMLEELSNYQQYGNITPIEADSIIDYLVKINA